MNTRPNLAAIFAVVLLIGSIGFAAYRLRSPSRSRLVSEGLAYFSIDDGKSWFADRVTQPAPFAKDGKPAYRAFVWTGSDGKPFVAYLQRIAGTVAPTNLRGAKAPPTVTNAGEIEVKRPGESKWTKANTAAGEAIMQPRADAVEPVEP
jgi:hypothetical protein